jgi:Na+-translocating ferredoxin:NAD+ oxidoreductase RnfG subunit
MRYAPFILLAPVVIPWVMPVAQANEYFDTAGAQRALFSSATAFIDAKVSLSSAERDQIKARSGIKQRWDEQPVWRVEKNGAFIGWYIEDRVIGKHEFIRYAAALSPDGHVLGIEIMEYLETYGDQVREATWRSQFLGKTLASPLDLGKDINNISGASLSCRNITNGVKRLLALQQVALTPPAVAP